jgi:CubicO group peptidase (beta-lactamase class C family)
MRLLGRIGARGLTLRVLACVALCWAPLVLVVGGQDQFDAIRGKIRALVDSGKVPSLVLAMGRDGRLVWSEAFGWADRDRRIPATPQTRYSVASVTKPFTATALMVLNERQQVSLTSR